MIVITLVVSNAGGTRVTTSYLIDDSMLNRNDEETHQYISASSCVAKVVYARESDVFSENHLATDHTSTGNSFFLTASITDLLAVWNEIGLHVTTHHEVHGSVCTRLLGWLHGHFPLVKMEVSNMAKGTPQDYAPFIAACSHIASMRLRHLFSGFLAGDCDVVVIELRAQDNVPVLLMNREGLYVIVANAESPRTGIPLRDYVLLRQLEQAEVERLKDAPYIVAFVETPRRSKTRSENNLLLLVAS
ncbi:hypothetical protein HPB51_028723 [Rhipicephalus microplus]|uniref:Uncharacterized protein n=1 Tax=Rhipicephalus microplus TaxID=6941 RepID=A0A9J6CWI5_RHIMP|nr:hypothetical protein HPB51_028723 [Rhipicephalus microplus]